MKNEIYEFRTYKEYLRVRIREREVLRRGVRSALAKAIGCQTSYLSRVLNGYTDLNLEQGICANRFLEHSKEESHFFLLMLQMNRADSADLKKYFKDQLDYLVQQSLVLQNRIKIKDSLCDNDRARYYSEWYYAAVHMIVLLPEYQNKEAIAAKLLISTETLANVLEFLISLGLVKADKRNFKIGSNSIHLASDSHFISKHHINWRLRAMQALERKDASALHYSSVMTCSTEDVVRIRAMMVKTIEEIRDLIRESNGEALYCYNLDLFEV